MSGKPRSEAGQDHELEARATDGDSHGLKTRATETHGLKARATGEGHPTGQARAADSHGLEAHAAGQARETDPHGLEAHATGQARETDPHGLEAHATGGHATGEPPVAVVTRRRRWSFAWIVPVLALLVVATVVWLQVAEERGPIILIEFDDAAGLEPEAAIVYRGLRVGQVREVRLAEDLSGVVVVAELAPHAADLARRGTEFWIVQPEVSLRRVAGLETIIGPRYIAARPGPEGAAAARVFDGLERAPRVSQAAEGELMVELRAAQAGSVTSGSPVLFRGIAVGAVRSMALADGASGVAIEAAIEPQYAALVRENTRFWVAGNVGIDWGPFKGLDVRTPTLDTLIEGAISFATPRRAGQAVREGHVFELEESPPGDWRKWSPDLAWPAEESR